MHFCVFEDSLCSTINLDLMTLSPGVCWDPAPQNQWGWMHCMKKRFQQQR